MRQIEVPDWVVEVAAKALFEDQCPLDIWETPMDDEERESWRDGARKIITAALGAWVVPVGQADTMPGTVGFTAAVFKTIDVGVAQPLYTLRQEKPE